MSVLGQDGSNEPSIASLCQEGQHQVARRDGRSESGSAPIREIRIRGVVTRIGQVGKKKKGMRQFTLACSPGLEQ